MLGVEATPAAALMMIDGALGFPHNGTDEWFEGNCHIDLPAQTPEKTKNRGTPAVPRIDFPSPKCRRCPQAGFRVKRKMVCSFSEALCEP